MKVYQKLEDQYIDEYLSNLEKGQRKGQAIFNAIHTVDPDTANKLRATDLDCYYFDERVKLFLEKVYEIWEAK